MTEVYFYHLEHQPLDKALASLLERSVARGWNAVLQAGSPERLEALDLMLWTYDDASFLAHGTQKDGHPELQKVFLTTGEDNPNGAKVRFLVDGAPVPADLGGYERAVYMFDGHDQAAVAEARAQWKAVKAAGHALSYWQQDDSGRWINRA